MLTEKIEILRCHVHGYWAIAIEDTRVTPEKCCGSWRTVRQWEIPALGPLKYDQADAIARAVLGLPPLGDISAGLAQYDCGRAKDTADYARRLAEFESALKVLILKALGQAGIKLRLPHVNAGHALTKFYQAKVNFK